MQSQRRSNTILLGMFLAAMMWSSVSIAQGDSAGAMDFDQAYKRAQELFDQGAYAQIKPVLEPLLQEGAGVSSREASRAAKLISRAEGVLLDRYDAVLEARQRAEKGAADSNGLRQRHERMLAEADRLVQEAAGEDADKLRKAVQIQVTVASERAIAAYDRAVQYFDQGKYDEALAAFQGLQKWVDQQNALDMDEKPSLGATRVERISEYIARVPVAKANYEAAVQLMSERDAARQAQAESEKKFREAMRFYDTAVRAFNHQDYQEAEASFNAVLASGVDLGGREADTRRYLARIEAAKNEGQETRDKAAAWLVAAEGLLADGDWRGAQSFLNESLKVSDSLSDEQRVKLADLTAKAESMETAAQDAMVAEKKRGETQKDAMERASKYLENVRTQRAILEQQRAATAQEYLQIARADYANNNLGSALENVDQALTYQPDNAEARALKLEIEALMGHEPSVKEIYGTRISDEIRARLDEVRGELDLAIQRGRIALDDNRFDDAVKQLMMAQENVDYLRPYFEVEGVESQIAGLLDRAKAGQEAQARALQEKRFVEAQIAAEEASRSERTRIQQQKVALFAEANAEFARGKYESCMALCDRILEVDPGNAVAIDLKYDAREAQRTRVWADVYETDKRNREDERLKLREKLIWPAALVQYPAKEVWAEISARTGVELPSAKAVKSPKELHLEAILDTELAGVMLPGVTLQEAVEILKTQLGEEVNFLIDPNIFEGFDILIQLDLKNVSLRTALLHMLRSKGMNFIISDGTIFISTVEGCRLEEAREENLSFRQYDVYDLLISLDVTGTASGAGIGGQAGGGGAGGTGTGGELVDLIVRFTGQENWEQAGTGTGTGTGGGTGGGAYGGGGGAYGGGGGAYGGGGGAYGGGGGAYGGGGYGADTSGGYDSFGAGTGTGVFGAYVVEGAGRTMWLREGYLMVNHVDRIHKRIEELLAELRSQVINQVKVEARLITFSDSFSKDIGVDWQGITFDTPSIGTVPEGNWAFSIFPGAAVSVSSVMTLSGVFIDNSIVTATVHAAKNSSHATVVSSPYVTILNGQEQTIGFTSTGTYISSYEVQNDIAVPTIDTYDLSVVALTVRPVISADRRYVTMTLNVDFTAGILVPTPVIIPVAGGGTAAGSGILGTIQTVVETSTALETICRVPDRGTMVLAGLASLGDTTGQNSVPILAHIPIIKRLFVRDAVVKDRTHAMVLVTPTIILQQEIEP